MDLVQGATGDLSTTHHQVNLKVSLTGPSGVKRVDYRTNRQILGAVGHRAMIYFVQKPMVELVTATSSDVSYNIRAVHYNRLADKKPADAAAIAAIPGSVEIVRSQLLNDGKATIGVTPNVTDLIKPDPLVGYSPCLDVAWESLGTTTASAVTLIVHCTLEAKGADLPEY